MTERRFAAVLVGVALVALAALASPSSSVTSAAAPDLGRTFVVSSVSGTVLVKPAGAARYSRLTGRRTIPVGSTVNATKGRVRLVGAADRGGGTQSGVFYGGAFRATQADADEAVIDLQLVGGRFAGCASGSDASASARRRLGRKLWGNARGNFRTRGKHSSATVRGTKWLTQDRCASTGIEARRGQVETKNVATDTPVELGAGDSVETLCVPKPDYPERDYCLQVHTDGSFSSQTTIFTVITRLYEGDYELCVESPRGARDCGTFPTTVYRGSGENTAVGAAICYPQRGKGTYKVSWSFQGRVLGVLPFHIGKPHESHPWGCPTSEGISLPPASAAASAPDLGRTFVVSSVSGTVLVKPAGAARYSRLTGRRTIPVGSTVNATKGRVRLVGAADRGGGTQSGVFYGGAFRATQADADEAVIDLQLVGGRFAGCASGSDASASARRRLGRKLWGNARGNFRTRGKHSSATVRGTKWLTQDRCASTGIAARSGTVEAANAATDEPVELDSGDSLETLCVPTPDAETRDYCLQVQTFDAFGSDTAILTIGSRLHTSGEYAVCVQRPGGERSCGSYPLITTQTAFGERGYGFVVCYAKRRRGTWRASWTVQGQELGTIPFEITKPWSDSQRRGCPTSEGVHLPQPLE